MGQDTRFFTCLNFFTVDTGPDGRPLGGRVEKEVVAPKVLLPCHSHKD